MTVLPYSSIIFVLHQIDGKNKIELIVDYNSSNIEKGYLSFTLQPGQTSLPSINFKPAQITSFLQLVSDANGVPLYSYSQELYDLQSTLEKLSLFVGAVSLIFLFIGFLLPVGKLIVV